MKYLLKLAALGCLFVMSTLSAMAQATDLPDATNGLTVTATVREQAIISVPATIGFDVTDVGAATTVSSGAISLTQIVLNDGKKIRLSLKASAASFTAAAGGSVTWAASDISWNTGAWTNGMGAANALDNAAYVEVMTSSSDNPASVTGSFTFTLAAKATVDRAGAHTLAATWKVESL